MPEKEKINEEFLEKLIFKSFTTDKSFLILISNAFEPEYFQNSDVGTVFKFAKDHLDKFKNVPPKEIVLNSLAEPDIKELFDESESLDFDIQKNFDFIVRSSNDYLKERAIRKAMMDSLPIIERNGDLQIIRENIENALCKDLTQDMGLEYFDQLGARLKRIFNATDIRIPTYYPTFDEIIAGGFPPLTLSVICAKIHGFKSNTMCNFAARQALHGHNVVILTLEMSQDMFAQRFDAIYALMDMNRMYLGDNQKELLKRLIEIKKNPNRKHLFIKQYPTGAASVQDFRMYLRELIMRGIDPDIVYVDYINLMKSAVKQSSDMYSSVKAVAQELRALAFEFKVPVVSVSQLNREGGFVGFAEIDFNYIAESMGIPATADFMSIFGIDEDALIYESELHNKIVKNRLGGRVGDICKFYYDNRSLKMYDEMEDDLWLADSKITGDTRSQATPRPAPPQNQRRKK